MAAYFRMDGCYPHLFSFLTETRSLWELGGPPGPLSPSGFAPIVSNLLNEPAYTNGTIGVRPQLYFFI